MTGALRDALDCFARIFSYPGPEYAANAARCRGLCEAYAAGGGGGLPALLDGLDRFQDAVGGMKAGELEELYTRTFDINPVSSLEVGWHLFGESYDRGSFLVEMRGLLRRCGVEESGELPDHLTHALLAVGRMDDGEARAFVSMRLLKAVGKILEGFAGKGNPYEHPLLAVKQLLLETCTTETAQEARA